MTRAKGGVTNSVKEIERDSEQPPRFFNKKLMDENDNVKVLSVPGKLEFLILLLRNLIFFLLPVQF